MNDCFICKARKSSSGNGLYCEVIGAFTNTVEFCALFPDGKKKQNSKKQKVDGKILERIQKLFQLGKSPNMNEAASALRKAQALMDEYDLSFGKVNYIVEREKRPGKKCYDWELKIFTAVCFANNCAPAAARGFGEFSLCGRKINVFLSIEMFNYLSDTVKRMAKEKCKGRGHKYNHDFKMAAAEALEERLNDYGERVSWAVDREEEIKNIKEFRKLPQAKKSAGENFNFEEMEAVKIGLASGKEIGLHKQTGIDEIKQIGANV
jgi:hypothetical protein